MKYTEGYWSTLPGMTPVYPIEVEDVSLEAGALTVSAATRPIQGRGDCLNIPLLTLRFSSPMPDIIRVQLVHFKGTRPLEPHFHLNEKEPAVKIVNEADFASLTSGRLTARIAKTGPWQIEYLDPAGCHLTEHGFHSMGIIQTASENYSFAECALGVGELVYGLGERFTALAKNGQVVDLWNEDGGTSSQIAYKNIPFYLTNRGYGVFVNHPERVSYEVASEKVERVQMSVPGESLDFFIIYGPSPKEILERYTALTGRPALPPAWSFGLWLTTSFTTNYDEATVTQMIDGMAERQIPLHVFHFDCFWMKRMQWVNFEWDPAIFPDPQAMLQRLKARGVKICLWINPYIAQRSPLFDEGAARGYLLKRPNGDVWQWDRWQPGMALVDFTNPAARQWYAAHLRRLVEMGVDCFKTDFGERIPTDVVYADGSDPVKMHNYYTLLYNQTVFEVLQEMQGAGNAVVFARSATTGGQQYPVHWGGDSTATFESMAESLRGGLSLGCSGFGFWSHDIGGFENTASADVYKRWCAFGLLSSHSRLHGSSSYRVPWLFDESQQAPQTASATEVLRFFTRLKCRLMPYLYAAAVEAHQKGFPVMRAMPLEFPADPACDTLDRQYMLGPSLLVAPVFRPDGQVDYYLPAGRWTHFLSGKTIEGGRWFHETYDYLSLPLWVRENTLLAVGANDTLPDYDFADGVTFHVFDPQDGVPLTCTVPDLDGSPAQTLTLTRNAHTLSAQVSDPTHPWALLLRGIQNIGPVTGGNVSADPLGTRIEACPGVSNLNIPILK